MFPDAPTRRSTTTGPPGNLRSAFSAIRASRLASQPCAPRPVSGASAIWAFCSTMRTGSRKPLRLPTSRTCIRRSSTFFSIRMIRRSSSRRDGTAYPTIGWRRLGILRFARWRWTGKLLSRCTRSTAPCRWYGMCRRCRRYSRPQRSGNLDSKAVCRTFVLYGYRSDTSRTF